MNRYSAIRRASRRIGLGRNPLRRRVDRVDDVVRLLTVVLAVGLVTATALVATTSYRAAADRRAAELGHRHLVTVVLLADTVPASSRSEAPAYRTRLPVRAQWTERGAVRTGDVYTRRPGRRGDRTSVWLDESGTPVRPLMTAGDLRARAWTGGLAVVGFGGLVLFAGYSMTRAATDRYRDAAWTAEWALVGERWRHRI